MILFDFKEKKQGNTWLGKYLVIPLPVDLREATFDGTSKYFTAIADILRSYQASFWLGSERLANLLIAIDLFFL